MDIFKLPDLGEGLPDAEIHEWFVQEGDVVILDQPLVAMETAKAVVEVPAPYAGTITRLFGKQGDIIKTGDALVGFAANKTPAADKGTVVGHLEESSEVSEDTFQIQDAQDGCIRITPVNRAYAKKLGVDITTFSGTGAHGYITRHDLESATSHHTTHHTLATGYEPLRGVRRAMLASMTQSHREVVSVSIYDDVDIEHWPPATDITVRLIQAMIAACQKEPALNAWYDTQHTARRLWNQVDLGIAMDSSDGLFVPVIRDAATQDGTQLRVSINALKEGVAQRALPPEDLKGATITLSNFGKFAGKYANPIIVPPQVAILGVGRIYQQAVAIENTIAMHRFLPLSLSFDHRAITGGEATRFLGTVMQVLSTV